MDFLIIISRSFAQKRRFAGLLLLMNNARILLNKRNYVGNDI